MLRELMRSRVHGESNLRIDRRQSRFRLLGLPTKQRRTSTQIIKGNNTNTKRF